MRTDPTLKSPGWETVGGDLVLWLFNGHCARFSFGRVFLESGYECARVVDRLSVHRFDGPAKLKQRRYKTPDETNRDQCNENGKKT
jgi:hypothetical protein